MDRTRILIGIVIAVALTGLGYFGYAQFLAPIPPTPTPSPTLTTLVSAISIVSAEGSVVPHKHANLSFKVGGRLQELTVEEGDEVAAGQVMAWLDPTDLQHQVDQAEAALKLAQAQLAKVEAGARPEEIAAAEGALDAAKAELARLEAGPKPEEIASARAAMKKAEAVLRAAQSEYDKISWMEGIMAMPQAVALEQATADYEAAKASYEALVRGATAEELDAARARVEQAQAQLDLLLAGATDDEVAAAEAQVEQAAAALAQARSSLEDATLVAPFAGTVGMVMVEEGEMVAAGAPVIVLGDLSRLQVETDDLSEVDISQVVVGQEVKVSVDALPDREFRGRVARIAPMAVERHGDTVYTVTIDLEEGTEAGLRWGMTAFVDIRVR